MYRVLTSEQSRAVEAAAVEAAGVTLAELMERAGRRVADEVADRFPDGRVVILAGPGNNGGDGWVAARTLHAFGREVLVLALREPPRAGEQEQSLAAIVAHAAIAEGVAYRIPGAGPAPLPGSASVSVAEDVRKVAATATVVVDALLGTGSRLPLSDEVAAWCAAANESGAPVLAVDLPTGITADSGAADSAAIRADVTVTFTAPKLGLVTYPAAHHAGDLVIADIGIPDAVADIAAAPELLTYPEYAALVPLPAPDAHKNSRGRLLVIAGSTRYPGAAVLATRGAQRLGAGYVTLAVPEPVVTLAQGHLVSAPVVGLPATASGSFAAGAALRPALDLAAAHDAVVLGPGLTLEDETAQFAREFYVCCKRPLVVDADALGAFAGATQALMARTAPTVLTPHPGELARLLGGSVDEVQADRVSSSQRLAGDERVVVLKGAGTVVSSTERSAIVAAGSPALATAGTGDVLAGMIGSLLAQQLSAFDAAVLGAHLHGMAGELVACEFTPVCATADDVVDFIPAAVSALLTAD